MILTGRVEVAKFLLKFRLNNEMNRQTMDVQHDGRHGHSQLRGSEGGMAVQHVRTYVRGPYGTGAMAAGLQLAIWDWARGCASQTGPKNSAGLKSTGSARRRERPEYIERPRLFFTVLLGDRSRPRRAKKCTLRTERARATSASETRAPRSVSACLRTSWAPRLQRLTYQPRSARERPASSKKTREYGRPEGQ